MKKISVIIPAYNCERYIRRCVESVISQKYEDYELILIDDASKDSTGEICDSFANHEGVKVIHNAQNEGVSASRNKGIRTALGSLICFVDADDYVDEGYLSKIEALFDNKTDLLVFPYYLDEGSKSKINYVSNLSGMCDKKNFYHFVFEDIIGGSACNKVFKKEIIDYHHISFPENLKVGEDMVFCLQYLEAANAVNVVSKQAYYHYFSNPDSMLHNRSRDKYLSVYYLGLYLADYYRRGFVKENREAFVYAITYLIMLGFLQSNFAFGKFVRADIEKIIEIINELGGRKSIRPKWRIVFAGLRFFPGLTYVCYRAFRYIRARGIYRESIDG